MVIFLTFYTACFTNIQNCLGATLPFVVYFDMLLGAARTQKLVKTFFSRFQPVTAPTLRSTTPSNIKINQTPKPKC